MPDPSESCVQRRTGYSPCTFETPDLPGIQGIHARARQAGSDRLKLGASRSPAKTAWRGAGTTRLARVRRVSPHGSSASVALLLDKSALHSYTSTRINYER